MNEPIDRAIRALPELNALVTEVLDLSSRIGSTHSSAADDPINSAEARARHMALMYVSKQEEHLRSVRVLIEAGQHRDAWLIARTMLEGRAQLEWALCHQPEGPDEWFWYEVIEDWRQLKKNLASGGTPDGAAASVAQDLLNQHGKDYYNVEARKKAKSGKPIPADPYRHKWNRLDTKSMFHDVEGTELYEGLYRAASGWLHWSPRQMHLAIVSDDNVRRHEINDPQRAAQALAAGIASLHRSIALLNDHIALGLTGLAEDGSGRDSKPSSPCDERGN